MMASPSLICWTSACSNCECESSNVTQRRVGRGFSPVYDRGGTEAIYTIVNTWLWQFGRGKPRIGGLTIEETSKRQDSASKSSDKRRKETRESRKRDGV